MRGSHLAPELYPIVVVAHASAVGRACQAALAVAGLEVEALVLLADMPLDDPEHGFLREKLLVVAAHPEEAESALGTAATIAPDHDSAVMLWWMGERAARLGQLSTRGTLECSSLLPPEALRAKVMHAVDRARWVASSRRAQTDAQRRGIQFDVVFRDSPDGLLEVTAAGTICRTNPAIARISGYSEAELAGQPVELLVPDAIRHHHAGLRQRFQSSGPARQMGRTAHLQLRAKSGNLVAVQIALVPMPFGDQARTFCVIKDLRPVLQLGDQVRALHAAVDAAADAMAIFEVAAAGPQLIYTNQAMHSLCGREFAGELADHMVLLDQFALPGTPERRHLLAALADQTAATVAVSRVVADRGDQHLDLRLNPVAGAAGAVSHMLLLIRDNSPMINDLRRLTELAASDPLTGLANRAEILARLDDALVSTRHAGQPLVAAMINIDRFRHVNEVRGHQAGDAVLAWAAARMQFILGPSWQIGRWGGDQFIAFAVALEPAAADSALAEFRAELAAADPGHGIPSLHISIGIAHFPQHAAFAADLVERAGTAVQIAKRQGGRRVVAYNESSGLQLRREFYLQCALTQALPRGELSVVYQPQVCSQTGALWGCEALLRWTTAAGETIGPLEFIPVAESCGLIGALGEFVARSAIGHLRQWRQAGLVVPHISVNVSAHCLTGGQLTERIRQLVAEHGMAPTDLRLEVTEGTAVDPGLIGDLEALADQGIAIALDDFGTGHSSLAALRRLPLTELKLDRAFLTHLPGQAQDAAVVKTVIDLAHHLGLEVVAEGVETEAQARWLRSAGCDGLQGYHYAPGLPPESFRQWCMDRQRAG